MARDIYVRRKKKSSTGKLYVAIVAMIMLIFMTVQIAKLYISDQEYKATQAAKQEELQAAQKKSEELKEKEQEVQSEEYIEKEARDKLGLVKDNEIIFREK